MKYGLPQGTKNTLSAFKKLMQDSGDNKEILGQIVLMKLIVRKKIVLLSILRHKL